MTSAQCWVRVLVCVSADDSQPRWRGRQPIARAYASLHPHRPPPRCRCRRPEHAATADPQRRCLGPQLGKLGCFKGGKLADLRRSACRRVRPRPAFPRYSPWFPARPGTLLARPLTPNSALFRSSSGYRSVDASAVLRVSHLPCTVCRFRPQLLQFLSLLLVILGQSERLSRRRSSTGTVTTRYAPRCTFCRCAGNWTRHLCWVVAPPKK